MVLEVHQRALEGLSVLNVLASADSITTTHTPGDYLSFLVRRPRWTVVYLYYVNLVETFSHSCDPISMYFAMECCRNTCYMLLQYLKMCIGIAILYSSSSKQDIIHFFAFPLPDVVDLPAVLPAVLPFVLIRLS